MELKELIWDDFNSIHILKHNVTKLEIYQACRNQILVLLTKKDRLLLIGKTNQNRCLSIVLSKVKSDRYYLVTARDSSKKERRLINE